MDAKRNTKELTDMKTGLFADSLNVLIS